MKKILPFKKHIILTVTFIFFLFLVILFSMPDKEGHSLQPPSPPPVPVPLVPSVLEDIRNTKHNLSSIGPGDRAVFTTQTTEICVFCHTPHGAISDEDAAGLSAPLWNRRLSTARYILYDQVWSTSFEGYETNPKPNAPTGYSRLCLSCHDGTIALGTVINPPGSGVPSAWNLLSPGTMPPGSGVTTGDTRVIGTNLQNDHPVSFVFDSSLAMRDEELVDPGPPLMPPARVNDTTPISPLRRYPGTIANKYDSVQCTSCHNPHAAKFVDGTVVPKFLRSNYYNEPENPDRGKIICLYCHDKPGWSGSKHDTAMFIPPANPNSANPYNFDGSHTVGQYACRACHDPHTVQGAKRLLREGVDFNNNVAIENTCFLCHKPANEMGNPSNPPPDIRSEFYKDANLGKGGSGSAMNLTMGQGHEPVFVSRPQEGVELLSLMPPSFNEYTPGLTIRDTVHIECVDCHNPHQVTRTNRLKGMKGIDINGKVVGAKIPGNSREPYVYEVCLRCHGNSYTNLFLGNRYPDDTLYRSDPLDTPPTEANLSLRGYSNKRKEFDPNSMDTAVDHTQQLNNPAFHPVAAAGRNGSRQLCKQLAVAFNIYESSVNPAGTNGNCDADPATALKNITIQCTDCHNNNAFGSSVKGPITGQPDSTNMRITDDPPGDYFMQNFDWRADTPQGPHGSAFQRILRNQYDTNVGRPTPFGNSVGRIYESDGRSGSHYEKFLICFQCHDRRAFDNTLTGTDPKDPSWTNFFGNPGANPQIMSTWDYNLHMYHLKLSGAYCHECHYNVHSNIEASNTIYGNGYGRTYPNCGTGTPQDPYVCLPPDNEDNITDGVVDTHLINFAPDIVEPATASKPRWYYTLQQYQGTTYKLFRCDLRCHGITMSPCHYKSDPLGLSNVAFTTWCAGRGSWGAVNE